MRRSRTTGRLLGSTDGFEHTDRPSDSGVISLVICACVACGAARTVSAQTAIAAVIQRRAGRLGIAAFQLGMEGRQRHSHELPDLALGRDARGIECAREFRLPGRQELMHLSDVLDLQ